MRRRGYENLWAKRQRWERELHGAPRRFVTAFGVVFAMMFAFWLVLKFFG